MVYDSIVEDNVSSIARTGYPEVFNTKDET